MMNLKVLEGKKVRLTDIDGEIFEGVVSDYVFPDDNEPEVEAIIMNYPTRDDGYKYQNPVQFNGPDIKFIEIIEKKKLIG